MTSYPCPYCSVYRPTQEALDDHVDEQHTHGLGDFADDDQETSTS